MMTLRFGLLQPYPPLSSRRRIDSWDASQAAAREIARQTGGKAALLGLPYGIYFPNRRWVEYGQVDGIHRDVADFGRQVVQQAASTDGSVYTSLLRLGVPEEQVVEISKKATDLRDSLLQRLLEHPNDPQ